MPDLDGVVLQRLAFSLSTHPKERHGMLVVGQEGMDVELEGPARQFHVLLEVGEDLVLAPKGPSDLAASRGVPDDVIGEKLIQRGDVAGGERHVATADKILIGMGHGFSSLRRAGQESSSGLAACRSTREAAAQLLRAWIP